MKFSQKMPLYFSYIMVQKVKYDQKLKSRGPANPLWGHCQEYKFEKNAILQERLLSEKRSTFVYYNLTVSESICFADHEKQIQKFVAYWKVCQKSSQREVIRKNAYKAPKPQGVWLPAFHLKFSRSLTNLKASPARQSSLRLKDRLPNHAAV